MLSALADSLRRIVDDDPCELDADGYCQTHLSDTPCKNGQALDVLAEYDAGVEPASDSDVRPYLDLIGELVDGSMCSYTARGTCTTHDQPGVNFECPHYRAVVLLGRMS